MKTPTLSLCSLSLLALSGFAQAQETKPADWVDFDADGLRDLLQIGSNKAVRLLRNEGGGHFTDVTQRVGLGGLHGARMARFADYDADGLDDVLFVLEDGSSPLFRATQTKSFELATKHSGLAFEGRVTGAEWLDFDLDGQLDLELIAGGETKLFRNLGQGTSSRSSWALRRFRESLRPPRPPQPRTS